MDVGFEDQGPAAFNESGPEVEEFANALDDCLSPLLKPADKRKRLLNLPQKYYENATRRLSRLQLDRTASYDDADMGDGEVRLGSAQQYSTIRQKLEQEVQTWDLFRRLLPLRYAEKGDKSSPLRRSRLAQTTPGDLVQEFLESSPLAQERRAVLQWLQSNAASRPDIDDMVQSLQQKAGRGDVIAHGWLHTRSSIKLRKSVTSWPHLLDKQSPSIAQSHTNKDGAPLVTQLDPDAVTRQERKLERQDEYFDRAVWLGCFEHLRRGSSTKTIRDWCQERTEMWRAVSMSAMLLSLDDQESIPETEASSLALWRRMCYGLARQEGNDDYERAVYGVLSGDLPSVANVGSNMDDTIFAHYNALLRTQFDDYLLSRCPDDVASNLTQTFPCFNAIQYHGDQQRVDVRFITTPGFHADISKQNLDPSKNLQAAFIADDIDQYFTAQGWAIAEAGDAQRQLLFAPVSYGQSSAQDPVAYYNADEDDGLRVVAHVYILVSLLNQLSEADNALSRGGNPEEQRAAQDNIIATYTDNLRRANLKELIPLYCSILDPSRRHEVLAGNLILEQDPQSQRDLLRLMKKADVDIAQYVRSQTALCFSFPETVRPAATPVRKLSIIATEHSTPRAGRGLKADFFGQDEDDVDISHQYVVRSLEWMMMVEDTWPDVFVNGARAYKLFLTNTHLTAARHLLERVTLIDICRALGMSPEDLEDDNFSNVDFWADKLQDSGITDLDPHKVMMDARNFRELEALVRVLDNLETMGSLVALSAEAPAANREYWAKVGTEIKATKDYMQPLLTEWLLTGIAAGDDELKTLRQMYLTETILAYVSALHFAGVALSRDYLLECMELASTVAEGASDLAAAFIEAGRMRELVEAFAACSKALAVATGGSGRSAGVGSKKLREMGWSRDLWSVKS